MSLFTNGDNVDPTKFDYHGVQGISKCNDVTPSPGMNDGNLNGIQAKVGLTFVVVE